MIVPDPIHDRPPGQNILRIDHPFRQGRATRPFVIGGRHIKQRRQVMHTGKRARDRLVAGLVYIAAFQYLDQPRRSRGNEVAFRRKIVGGRINHLRRGESRQLFIDL